MSTGLLALLDDVAAIAKVAAASIDDIGAHAAKAGAKSAGVVIDDAAVTPRYVVGFAAERELPIVMKIARGSLKNKLIFLLPAALLLSVFAPWAITPLLMMGGLFLCYEGAEKVYGLVLPHHAHSHEEETGAAPADPVALENQKVASAIKTDFILSAEIMALSLSTVADASLVTQAIVLAIVGTGITLGVYGAVGLIVKADDIGVALAAKGRTALGRSFGRWLVKAMPGLLKALTLVGTVAMLWVGGGIILHGLEVLGLAGPAHAVHDLAQAVGNAVPLAQRAVQWLTGALASGIFGLVIGLLLIPVVGRVVAPVWSAVRG